MRFLADENFPRPALLVLRQAGFDVDAISEGLSGSSDEGVLGVASAAGRTLLTFDKDFGELAIRRGLPAECGVILFRLVPKGPAEAGAVALATLRSASSWAGQFTVVTSERIRIRPLPVKRREHFQR